ncbi:MAG TPA: Cof-type HAD-IIB family hydrolase [Gaiellaceae bacterium]|nr:Cof-type HAD-IIB family hydrolase [Gaiellaceae bacterium]
MRVVATDLDDTLIWTDRVLRPRTLEALGRVRAAGVDVIVVTGRMVQSLQRVLPLSLLGEPAICYQGAVVVDADGTWLRHVPIETALAKEAIAAVEAEGYEPNVYVDDELYVSRMTDRAEAYAAFQGLEVHVVGDARAWLDRPATKIVVVGDPHELDAVEVRQKRLFENRLTISKSLPHFLEFTALGITKAAGLDFLAGRMGFTPQQTIAFGDGENDVELVAWAGYGVAVANAHARVKAVADWVCPSAADEGVATVLEALLDSRP